MPRAGVGVLGHGFGCLQQPSPRPHPHPPAFLPTLPSPCRFPIFFYLTSGLTASELQNKISEVLIFTWAAGFDVCAMSFDGAAGNRAWAALATWDISFSRQYAWPGAPEPLVPACFRHPVDKQPVFCLPDGPHLVKK